jgi:glucose-1-phosphate thymidylyltransferase
MELHGVVVVEDVGAGPGPATGARTAALDHVANRPIIDHVVDALVSAGVDDLILVSSVELSDEVRQAISSSEEHTSRRIRHLTHGGPVSVAQGVELALPLVGDAACVVHVAHGMLAEPLQPLVDTIRSGSPDAVVVVHHGAAADERLSGAAKTTLNIAELGERAALGMAGVWLFGEGALRHAGSAPWQGSPGVDVSRLAQRIDDACGRLNVSHSDHWRRYAGNPLDLLELNQIALDRLTIEPRRSNGNGNVIEGRVEVGRGASIRDSVVVGPAAIGPNVQIADAYIGPYTAIGADARVEGAEIERSIIASGASITHIGGRLVASVVGRDARVFRDFSLPRALRLRVGAGTEIALC